MEKKTKNEAAERVVPPNKIDQLKDMMKAKKAAEEKKQEQKGQSSEQSQSSADEMTAQIKAAEDQAKEHYDKLLRVMAEFENFKKRIERERTEQAKYSNQSMLHDMMPVLDDFDRVLDHIPKETSPEITAIADGVKLIQNHLLTALAKHGLTSVECCAGDQFDPNFHEAVAHIESEQPAGSIATIHRKGWKLHDRVIRPATVAVSKEKK